MEAGIATFSIIFLAELGDKTQLLVMALAAKYAWRQVLLGMTLGIFVVHALAVGVGNFLGGLLAPDVMALIASLVFLAFGLVTLRSDEAEDEEEQAAPARFGPVLTVAASFFLGEMGDKTQFAALTLAAQWQAWLPVLLGAVLAMLLADSLGLVAGSCLKRFLAPRRMRLLSGLLFLVFGAAGLVQLVAVRL